MLKVAIVHVLESFPSLNLLHMCTLDNRLSRGNFYIFLKYIAFCIHSSSMAFAKLATKGQYFLTVYTTYSGIKMKFTILVMSGCILNLIDIF